jgi:hypothetical protein
MGSFKRISSVLCHRHHVASQNVPVFKLPYTDFSPGTPASAKTDFLSTKAPMFLELKSGSGIGSKLYSEDCDVLTQAIERVYMAGKVNEGLKTVISFASTGVKTWIFILMRTYPSMLKYNEEKIAEHYYLLPIAAEDVFPLWHILNEKPSNFFIREDCVLLSETLSSLGYHLGYCQLRVLHMCVLKNDEAGNGNHTMVYKVTPGYVHASDNYVTIPPHSETNSITVKLSVDSARGVKEYQILQKLCSKKSTAVDYVLMGLRSEANTEKLFMFDGDIQSLKPPHTKTTGIELAKSSLGFTRFPSGTSYHVLLDVLSCSANCTPRMCWWNYARPEGAKIPNFTAIVMHSGQRVRKLYPHEAVALPLLLTNEIHVHDVLHCDPRKQNILRFKSLQNVERADNRTKEWTTEGESVERGRLIDFDLSEEKEREIELIPGGRTHLLETMPSFVNPFTRDGKRFVRMNKALDSAMLGTVIERFPRYPPADEQLEHGQDPLSTNLFSAEFDPKLVQDHPSKEIEA